MRHTKKQESMTHTKDKKTDIETTVEGPQRVYLAKTSK